MGMRGVVDRSPTEEALAGDAGGFDNFSCKLISFTGPPLMLNRSCSISGDAISSMSSRVSAPAVMVLGMMGADGFVFPALDVEEGGAATAWDFPDLPPPSFSFVDKKLRNELSKESLLASSSAVVPPPDDIAVAVDEAVVEAPASECDVGMTGVLLLESLDRSVDVFRMLFSTFSSVGLVTLPPLLFSPVGFDKFESKDGIFLRCGGSE